MDQNKNQGQRQPDQPSGQPHTPQKPQTPNPSRESRGERNRGEGISNRGIDRDLDEQDELPERGSSEDRESER